jgi:hypothetical protein
MFASQVRIQRRDQGARGLLMPLDHLVGVALQAGRHVGGEPLVLGAVGGLVLLPAQVAQRGHLLPKPPPPAACDTTPWRLTTFADNTYDTLGALFLLVGDSHD